MPQVPDWIWWAILIYCALGFLVVQSPHAESDKLMTFLGDLFKLIGLLIVIDKLETLIRVLGNLVIIFSANG